MEMSGYEGKMDHRSRGSLWPDLSQGGDAWDSYVLCLPSALGSHSGQGVDIVRGCCDSWSSLKVCQPR